MKICEGMIQGSLEWLDWRQKHIGASERAAILGLNPFCTPMQIFEEKTLGWTRPMNDVMRQGQLNEPEARSLYEMMKGVSVLPIVAEWETFPVIAASFDGINLETKHLVEIKCGKSSFNKAKQGIIPAYYICQMQQQMLVSDFEEVDYFCYDAETKEYILMKVDRDEELINRIIDKNIHFWDHVCNFKPPEDLCCNLNYSNKKET